MESTHVILQSINDFQDDIECYDASHDEWLTRPMSAWRITLADDSQEFDCVRCFSRRLEHLGAFNPITVVRIRKRFTET
jgi:hypothetical protein